jgi:hypothetical protein
MTLCDFVIIYKEYGNCHAVEGLKTGDFEPGTARMQRRSGNHERATFCSSNRGACDVAAIKLM